MGGVDRRYESSCIHLRGSGGTLKHSNSSSVPDSKGGCGRRRTAASEAGAHDAFHVIHKIPAGDGPYVKAKHVQIVDKDPQRAIALFWAAINAGDRVDSALKDMAILLKQQNRSEEAIEAIKSLRSRCSHHSQEALNNILLDLFKTCGRLDEQIALLKHKLQLLHHGSTFNGKLTKTARSQGKKFQVSFKHEVTRILGNLGWAYMQQANYVAAEAVYRKALSIEPDNNRLCNLGICLLKQGKLMEGKLILQCATPICEYTHLCSMSRMKCFDHAKKTLDEYEDYCMKKDNITNDVWGSAAAGLNHIATFQMSVCAQRFAPTIIHEPQTAMAPFKSELDERQRFEMYPLSYGNRDHTSTGSSCHALSDNDDLSCIDFEYNRTQHQLLSSTSLKEDQSDDDAMCMWDHMRRDKWRLRKELLPDDSMQCTDSNAALIFPTNISMNRKHYMKPLKSKEINPKAIQQKHDCRRKNEKSSSDDGLDFTCVNRVLQSVMPDIQPDLEALEDQETHVLPKTPESLQITCKEDRLDVIMCKCQKRLQALSRNTMFASQNV